MVYLSWDLWSIAKASIATFTLLAATISLFVDLTKQIVEELVKLDSEQMQCETHYVKNICDDPVDYSIE